jgi:hypothetical protein
MLILKTLALEPMHGYGVALRIEQVSEGVFRSVWPVLWVSLAMAVSSKMQADAGKPAVRMVCAQKKRRRLFGPAPRLLNRETT